MLITENVQVSLNTAREEASKTHRKHKSGYERAADPVTGPLGDGHVCVGNERMPKVFLFLHTFFPNSWWLRRGGTANF